MKKMLVAFLLISMMAMPFAVPAMANTVAPEEPTKGVLYQEIAPFTEITVIYHRWSGGRLQFRVWGMVSMRWLTDWQYV
ncbi:MAG: hypothetical protein FWF80_08105 [Defluviitaleaceae bacterium]|nr:hypothetical protein [Defluviitaleaceae bacterium]